MSSKSIKRFDNQNGSLSRYQAKHTRERQRQYRQHQSMPERCQGSIARNRIKSKPRRNMNFNEAAAAKYGFFWRHKGEASPIGRIQDRKKQSFDMLGLRNSFRFAEALRLSSTLISMAKRPKELALLGGTFLFGLGALELCLRFAGF